jgi:hypothetical protein
LPAPEVSGFLRKKNPAEEVSRLKRVNRLILRICRIILSKVDMLLTMIVAGGVIFAVLFLGLPYYQAHRRREKLKREERERNPADSAADSPESDKR